MALRIVNDRYVARSTDEENGGDARSLRWPYGRSSDRNKREDTVPENLPADRTARG